MTNNNKYNSYIYLLIGFIFLFFFNGRWILPIAAFIAPVFLIRFLRFQKPLVGFLILILIGWISNIFVWKEMNPMTGFLYYFVMFMMSVFTSLIFILDKLYSQKIKGILSTLVFPAAYVIMEFIVVSTNPSGSYGTLAHTQNSLPLLQMLSVTGIWGVVFIVLWTSSLINWLWDNSFEKSKINLAFFIYGIPLIVIILLGQLRLSFNSGNQTVKIASINISKSDLENRVNAYSDSLIDKSNNSFLSKCEIAVTSGAKIIFGIETVITLKEDKEELFINKAKTIAKKNNIYLGLPMAVILKGFPQVRPENKLTWISPQGEILFEYHKAKPTPGEGDYGDGILKYFDTPYGRISSTICFDMDFPSFIRQVHDMNIDIMLVPGNDWREISPYHTYVASARAIEDGFNLVRAASRGLSASFDYTGKPLSYQDFYSTDDVILYSDVPMKGTKTIYSKFGDYFAWMCVLFFLSISLIFIKRTWINKKGIN